MRSIIIVVPVAVVTHVIAVARSGGDMLVRWAWCAACGLECGGVFVISGTSGGVSRHRSHRPMRQFDHPTNQECLHTPYDPRRHLTRACRWRRAERVST